ncbi:hypothetical protein D3C85_414900 [compost metagenome]
MPAPSLGHVLRSRNSLLSAEIMPSEIGTNPRCSTRSVTATPKGSIAPTDRQQLADFCLLRPAETDPI